MKIDRRFIYFLFIDRSKLRIEPLHGFQLIIEPTVTKKQDKNAICFHEDGGYKALFEAISESKDQIQVHIAMIYVEPPIFVFTFLYLVSDRFVWM